MWPKWGSEAGWFRSSCLFFSFSSVLQSCTRWKSSPITPPFRVSISLFNQKIQKVKKIRKKCHTSSRAYPFNCLFQRWRLRRDPSRRAKKYSLKFLTHWKQRFKNNFYQSSHLLFLFWYAPCSLEAQQCRIRAWDWICVPNKKGDYDESMDEGVGGAVFGFVLICWWGHGG